MNCSSTHLTSDPTRVMFLTWQQPDSTAAALNKFCSICTPNGVYTEFGIDPWGLYYWHDQNPDQAHIRLRLAANPFTDQPQSRSADQDP